MMVRLGAEVPVQHLLKVYHLYTRPVRLSFS